MVYTPFYTQDFCRFKCNSDKVMTCWLNCIWHYYFVRRIKRALGLAYIQSELWNYINLLIEVNEKTKLSIPINAKYYKVTNLELGLQAPQFARHILTTESSMLVHARVYHVLVHSEVAEICHIHILFARNLFILLSSHLMLWYTATT